MTEIYTARTDELYNDSVFRYFYGCTPLHRKNKIDKFVDKQKKISSLGAWLLLARVLEEKGISSESLSISVTENGKPFFPEMPGFHFNLSHSGKVVLCAISGRPVGCDTEEIRTLKPDLANRFFSVSECALLDAAPTAEERQHLFFRLWTLKESFLKATGQTISSLSSCSISIEDNEVKISQNFDESKTFFFREFSLEDGYCYACCSEQNEFSKLKTIQLI